MANRLIVGYADRGTANMTSFGEGEIHVSASVVGRARVQSLYAGPAIFPQLVLNVGVTLHDRKVVPLGTAGAPLTGYELRDASGELRFTENAGVIGALVWAGPRRFVRSSDWGAENTIRLTCDLDPWRLEQIEKRRGGAAPRFWVQLWPTLMSASAVVDADIRAFEVHVPRETWLEFYSKTAGSDFDILELRYPVSDGERFKRAIERSRDARTKILSGEYDEAVGLCRNVLDALVQDLTSVHGGEPLRAMFEYHTDSHLAPEYVALIGKVRRLTNLAHHEFGTPMKFTREEALFVARVTEEVLSLVGALSTRGLRQSS